MELIDVTIMKRISFLVVALTFNWFSVGQAQVSFDPSKRAATKVQEPNLSNSSSYHDSISEHLNFYIDRQTTSEPNRHLELHKQQGQGRSDNRTGPVFNPITIYWK